MAVAKSVLGAIIIIAIQTVVMISLFNTTTPCLPSDNSSSQYALAPKVHSSLLGVKRAYLQVVFSSEYDSALLDHFVQHYIDNLGIERGHVLVVLHGKTEAAVGPWRNRLSREFGIRRIDYWVGPYSSDEMSIRRNRMLDEAVGPDDWVIHTDSDQFHELPLRVDEFLANVEMLGYNAVYGRYVDRVAADGALSSIQKRQTLDQQFPLVCDVTSKILFDGGSADRPSEPQKVVAFKGGMRANRGGGKLADETNACIFPVIVKSHHYKWTSGLPSELIERIAVYKTLNKPWYVESERFLNHLKDHEEKICVKCPDLNCQSASTLQLKPLTVSPIAICNTVPSTKK